MIIDGSIPVLFNAVPLSGHPGTESFDAGNYAAFGAALLAIQPTRVFEIGTFRGATSQYVLDLLPQVKVVSIALDGGGNNLLPVGEVGALVTSRGRFTQLLGSSHELDPVAFTREYGSMEVVLIDGDHSYNGVAADTVLAFNVLARGGTVFWHDAGNSRKYPDVERFLRDAPFTVVREGSLACCTFSLAPAIARFSSLG